MEKPSSEKVLSFGKSVDTLLVCVLCASLLRQEHQHAYEHSRRSVSGASGFTQPFLSCFSLGRAITAHCPWALGCAGVPWCGSVDLPLWAIRADHPSSRRVCPCASSFRRDSRLWGLSKRASWVVLQIWTASRLAQHAQGDHRSQSVPGVSRGRRSVQRTSRHALPTHPKVYLYSILEKRGQTRALCAFQVL